MARLFVAVWPPPDVVRLLSEIARPQVEGLRWTSAEQWHLTLRFLGSVADVDAAALAFRRVVARPAVAVAGPATERFGDRVLHVPVRGLEDLAAAVVTATADIGEPPDGRPFNGHITMARPRGRAKVRLAPLTGIPAAAEWPVDEITLVASTTLPAGARYEVIDRVQVPGDVP